MFHSVWSISRYGRRRSMVIDALKRDLMSPDFAREFITALALLPGMEITANTDTLNFTL
jgi:hypothetical protein